MPEYRALTEEQDKIFADIVRLYREGFFGAGRRRNRVVTEENRIRALAVGSHAPDAVQAVQLCELDWTPITGETPDAENPSLVTIPDGTRLLISPGGPEAFVIDAAFGCVDPA